MNIDGKPHCIAAWSKQEILNFRIVQNLSVFTVYVTNGAKDMTQC